MDIKQEKDDETEAEFWVDQKAERGGEVPETVTPEEALPPQAKLNDEQIRDAVLKAAKSMRWELIHQLTEELLTEEDHDVEDEER